MTLADALAPARQAATSLAWIAANIDLRGAKRRAALRARIGTVLAALGAPASEHLDTRSLLARVEETLATAEAPEYWLALSVLSGRSAQPGEVVAAFRRARLDGPLAALAGMLTSAWLRGPGSGWPEVRVLSGATLVDLQHTSQTDFATGIQRVARETSRRWHENHDITLVGWSRRFDHLRLLSASEQNRGLYGSTERLAHDEHEVVVVPWRSDLLIPELAAEPPRTRALAGIAQYSRGTLSAIGFDCVPITSAETVGEGMGNAFSLNLAALSQGHRIATISHGAYQEYAGWKAMLRGAGLSGPELRAVSLPVEAPEPSAGAMQEATDRLTVAGLDMVLVVGSHEPRKNHLTVLHAAEQLWREGLLFTLVFVGGNSWNGSAFTERLNQLRAAGRPVESVKALSDDLLWAAYRIARFTVFPSLNEGFGLPVAESLASGTPAITSGFGSMAEIAADGGALLVDPRDDRDVADAMRRLMVDDTLLARLRDQAARRPKRTWDDYAREVWQFLTAQDGVEQTR